MKKTLLCVAAAATLAAGCATTESNTEPLTDREYTTGSNIPKRTKSTGPDGVQVIDRESIERNQVPLPGRPGATRP